MNKIFLGSKITINSDKEICTLNIISGLYTYNLYQFKTNNEPDIWKVEFLKDKIFKSDTISKLVCKGLSKYSTYSIINEPALNESNIMLDIKTSDQYEIRLRIEEESRLPVGFSIRFFDLSTIFDDDLYSPDLKI